MNKNIALTDLRQNYESNELLEEKLKKSPINQFEMWFDEAMKAKILEPNAMHLATVSAGKPHGRIVLLKVFDEKGFVFYTNYNSHKGADLAETPFAALTFFWDKLERQVRIEGKVTKVSEAASDEYFHSRPRGSQIGAWVSAQSHVIEHRNELTIKQLTLEEKFKTTEIIPRPSHWGGYCLEPESIEFWQGRPSRLHDRILYTKQGNTWKIERLEP